MKKKIIRKAVSGDDSVAEEFLLAHRYLYYCLQKPLLSDHDYDDLERALKPRLRAGSALNRPGSDNESDYPPHVRALAIMLLLKFCKVIPDKPTGTKTILKKSKKHENKEEIGKGSRNQRKKLKVLRRTK